SAYPKVLRRYLLSECRTGRNSPQQERGCQKRTVARRRLTTEVLEKTDAGISLIYLIISHLFRGFGVYVCVCECVSVCVCVCVVGGGGGVVVVVGGCVVLCVCG